MSRKIDFRPLNLPAPVDWGRLVLDISPVRANFEDQIAKMTQQLNLDEVSVFRVRLRFSELAAELEARPSIARFFDGMHEIWKDEKERHKHRVQSP